MALFHYRAASVGSETVDGHLEAASPEAVVAELQKRGYVPIRVQPAGTASGRRGGGTAQARGWLFGRRRGGAGAVELASLMRALATLVDAGLSLDEALASLAERGESPAVRDLVERTRTHLREGRDFGDALMAADPGLPPYVASLIRAGEVGGAMAEVLDELASFMEKSLAVAAQIRSALIYPILLLLLSIGSILVFLTVVLPQFATLFDDNRDALPALTAFFLDLGSGFETHGWLVIAALVLFLLVLRLARGSAAASALGDRLLSRLPFIGDLRCKSQAARFARTLGVLLRNGVSALPALEIVEGTMTSPGMRAAVGEMRESLRAGTGLATPMESSGEFPYLACRLTAVGERSGTLDRMLTKIADILDVETAETTKRLLAVLVPVLTLGSAGLIALVVGSIFSALLTVYDIAF